MEGTVLMRTLTFKSVLWSGKHTDLSVQQIIDVAGIGYLVWLYYSNEKINFVDEILKKIQITDDLKIPKPGKNDQMKREWKKKNLTDAMRIDNFHKKNRIAKFRSRSNDRYNNFNHSKGALKAKNHGK